VLDLIQAGRAPDFRRKEDSLWQLLPTLDPAKGLDAVPVDARAKAIEIAAHYQTFAYLLSIGAIDERLAALSVSHRIHTTWSCLEPFVGSSP
jgi:hypothetical protein